MQNTQKIEHFTYYATELKSNFDEFKRFLDRYYEEEMQTWDCELQDYFKNMAVASAEIDKVILRFR